MDWASAIDRNREDLLTIVTSLFVLAGIRTGRAVAALPRSLRIRILAMLRPAEYAVRRLIVMAACGLKATPFPERGTAKKTDKTGPAGNRAATAEDAEAALPAFALFDPFKRTGHPWLEGGEDQAGAWHSHETGLGRDDLIDAKSLCRRIRVLERALQDLERQAARLARWRARRHRESCRPRRFSPMRPGRPPGWRKRPRTSLEEVLKECHFLARDAWDSS